MKLYMFPLAPNPTRVRLLAPAQVHRESLAIIEYLEDVPNGLRAR